MWLVRQSRVGLLLTWPLILVLVAGSQSRAADKVVFSIVERVQFSVPEDWTVIASKSDANRTIFAFQIANPAEEGTPDSSNLVVNSYYLKDSDAKAAFEKRIGPQHPKAQKKNLAENWDCNTFSAMQGSTSYEDWDCTRVIGDCGVFVRIAWPHLPKNPPDYDDQMKAALLEVLNSVVRSPK